MAIAIGLSGRTVTAWPFLIACFSAPLAMLIWHIHAGLHPRVVCPNCGDSWEYDLFLKTGVCEHCGLALDGTPRG